MFRRRSQALTAVRAIETLLSRGVVEIRSLARASSNAPAEAGAVARIYLIADVCDGFAGTLTRATGFRGERTARKALVWTWGTATPEARRWIVGVLSELGPDHGAFLDGIDRAHRQWQAEHPVVMHGSDAG